MVYNIHYCNNKLELIDEDYTQLSLAKKELERLMEGDSYENYETAFIHVYNNIGRKSLWYYYSKKQNKWVVCNVSLTSYSSWNTAKEPFKTVAQNIIKMSGLKKKQDDELMDTIRKHFKNEKIEEL